MKKLLATLCMLCLFLAFLCQRPAANVLPQAKPTDTALLVPLDSRPVCSNMVQQIASLAGLDVILPPKTLLDNYRQPADREKLCQWLQKNANNYPYKVISTDLLLHGGLLATRTATATQEEEQRVWSTLESLKPKEENSTATTTAIFSVIPRLLVSDDLYPDCWYQFHLMRYSQLLDMVEISNNPVYTEKLLEYQEEIPSDVLQKYINRFQRSQAFNSKLLQGQYGFTVIGQDDSSPLGLPHRSARALATLLAREGLTEAAITYGADEIAVLLLTRHILQKQNYRPKIFLQFATPAAEFKHLPYMACSTGAALRNQIELLGAREASNAKTADIICYIYCGDSDKGELPSVQQANAVKDLLAAGKPIALVDSSANYEAQELLLPFLLEQNVSVQRLAAYAGWNTFSNSSGTALAQACNFTAGLHQLHRQQADTLQLAGLYAANLRLNVLRMLDDYYYQKRIHPQLRPYLESFGVTPTDLSEEEKLEVERYIQGRLSLYAVYLQYKLSREPFYENYRVNSITVGTRLPWSRIFEVELNPEVKVGK
ncbi:DUF4127 family protein [Phascolarctobacterium sp.]|uniref:DUF4127 family protein n=1 Tax=Phascolarctobacterium sp. TaxID=2049039 RepID=UPI0038700311